MVGDCVRGVGQLLTSEVGVIKIVLREVVLIVYDPDMTILSAGSKLDLLCCIKDRQGIGSLSETYYLDPSSIFLIHRLF